MGISLSLPYIPSVDFRVVASGRTQRVEGRFPLTDPWWEVTCRVGRPRSGRVALHGFPSYALRRDLSGENGSGVVALFLNACGASPDHVTLFMEWCAEAEGRDVGELSDLPELLEEFGELGEQNKTAAEHMRGLVSHSVAGACVYAATQYPLVMRHLPTLLPRQFRELLGMGKRRDTDPPQERADAPRAQDLLERLEEVIESEVWKMGFSHILYRDLGLIRCEARLEAFTACGLFQNVPELQRHALLVYEQLKVQCQRSGSTYVERGDLEELLAARMAEVCVWAAVRFLKEQGIVLLERQKVVLRNLYTYETGIGERLAGLTRGADCERWCIDLDVRHVLREAQEERLRRAEAKVRAEAGIRTPGGLVNGAGASHLEPEGMAVAMVDAAQDRAGADGQDRRHYNGETKTPSQAPSQDGGSSWDVTFDLTYSTPNPSQEAPGPGEAGSLDAPVPRVEVELDPDQVRAAEMICANPVTVISGKGGCGKTTVVSLVFKAAMQQLQRDREEVRRACHDFQNDSAAADSQPNDTEGDKQEEKEEEEEKKKKNEEKEEKVEVLLTAPTGRAAGLLTKRTGFTAYTMHQVLFSYMNWKKLLEKKAQTQTQAQGEAEGEREGEEKRAAWKFRQVRALVVDEGSLVSVQILHSLLAILATEARLQKFILLGDVRQLPSIEPGNALYDLFHSLGKVRWSIEMRTNHRAESELIVKNAGQIADMGQRRCYSPLDFDSVVDTDYSPDMPSPDKRFIYVRVSHHDTAVQDAVSLLLRHGAGLQDHRTSQFIAFRRKDCALINELCCQHYVNHATRTHRRRLDFRVGDKICCTRNNYVPERSHELGRNRDATMATTAMTVAAATQDTRGGLPAAASSDPQEGSSRGGRRERTGRREKRKGGEKEEEKEVVKERLCNGEIFYITEDVTLEDNSRGRGRKRRYILLDDGQGKELYVLFREVQRLCRIQHAWARTIHTFQGSEAETIVYVVGSGAAQDWRHVYTAVTRGQKRVYVVSRDADIEMAIKRPVRRRNTRLAQLVRELVTPQGPGGGEEDVATQPSFSQPHQGTPSRQAPGFWPPQASQTPSQTPGPSRLHKDIKVEDEEHVDQNVDNPGPSGLHIKEEKEVKTEKKIKVEIKIKEENEEHVDEYMNTSAVWLRQTPEPSGRYKAIKVEKEIKKENEIKVEIKIKEENEELACQDMDTHATWQHTPGPSSMRRDIKDEDVGQDLDTSDACLQDDLNFSQAYNWSPMDSTEDHTALHNKCLMKDSSQVGFSRERNLFGDVSGPQESPGRSKRVGDFECWSTPPKQPRVASVETPTGASSLGLLTLSSPSPPAPVVKHLFPREPLEATASPSPPFRFSRRGGLFERFAAGAAAAAAAAPQCKQEGEEGAGGGGGAGPSSSHPEEASPSRTVPGFGRPLCCNLATPDNTVPLVLKCQTMSKVAGKDANSQSEACLQDDLAFSQAYTWSPMSCAEDPSAMPHGSAVAERLDFRLSEEADILQEQLNSS
ncbi:hypothetical protein ACEWY4_016161 [Coilia grayii]|uniref:UvrD-like helicase C-terminal domain-containing protein n=1 Tax=Coilia grayii TaxID=363190 RepID=A0ABD1JMY7_9TELE